MAYLQVSIDQAVFNEDNCRYYIMLQKQTDENSEQPTQMRTSTSGESKLPIFNINSFNLGDLLTEDPSSEVVFAAFKVTGGGQQIEIGSVTVLLATL